MCLECLAFRAEVAKLDEGGLAGAPQLGDLALELGAAPAFHLVVAGGLLQPSRKRVVSRLEGLKLAAGGELLHPRLRLGKAGLGRARRLRLPVPLVAESPELGVPLRRLPA